MISVKGQETLAKIHLDFRGNLLYLRAMKRIPKLCRHKSGRAYITDPRTKKEVYLGTHGTPAATRAYERWLAEYLAAEERHPRTSQGCARGHAQEGLDPRLHQ